MKIGVSSYSFSKYKDETGCSYFDICDKAKEIGFDGFLTIERECGEDPIGDIKMAVGFLKDKLAKLQ